MEILFITMDSLEANCSANIRNRGLIYGLLALEHKVDTCSLEKSFALILCTGKKLLAEF